MPTDTHSAPAPELTIRAVLTGMAIGAILTPCNVYSGLKIGWAFNMSVAAGLIAYALWNTLARIGTARPLDLKENNINQTAASSAASIVSSGLAAPIPALTLLTGQELAWDALAIWLFVVSLLGVVVAAGLRNQMLMRENLSFPSGVVTAEAMQEIHAGGREAASRLRALAGAGVVAAGLKAVNDFAVAIPKLAPPLNVPFTRVAEEPRAGESVSFSNLGLALDPSLLMVGFGALAGLRVGLSALLGAVIAWGLLAPVALSSWLGAGGRGGGCGVVRAAGGVVALAGRDADGRGRAHLGVDLAGAHGAQPWHIDPRDENCGGRADRAAPLGSPGSLSCCCCPSARRHNISRSRFRKRSLPCCSATCWPWSPRGSQAKPASRP